MQGMQKERLKRLLSTAILQLWKKETGSLASVFIEGTVCITPAGGRTTVVQVADHFIGAIPEGYTGGVVAPIPIRRPVWGCDVRSPPHVDCAPPAPNMAVAMASYFEELSPASLVSPTGDSNTSVTDDDSPCATNEETAAEALTQLRDSGESESGPVCPGTGYYTRDDGIDGSSTESSGDDDVKPKPPSALDLSRRDPDLALSPPHSYTAQVRDVIRQRLLAGRPSSHEVSPPVSKRACMSADVSWPVNPVMNTSGTLPSRPYHVRTPDPPTATLTDNTLQDTLCNGVRPSPSSLEAEKDQATAAPDQKVYKCEYCAKSFLFKSKYHEHLPVHTNARPYRCPQCARTYKYKYDLRVHLRTHMGIPTKSTVCPFCTARCDTNKLLRAHIRDQHADGCQVEIPTVDCVINPGAPSEGFAVISPQSA